ncbi:MULTISPECIES: sporulation histidine kinase inhibitor Sda [Bacillaceae]
MQNLSTEQLFEALIKAIELNTSKDFILLLVNEINQRIIDHAFKLAS